MRFLVLLVPLLAGCAHTQWIEGSPAFVLPGTEASPKMRDGTPFEVSAWPGLQYGVRSDGVIVWRQVK